MRTATGVAPVCQMVLQQKQERGPGVAAAAAGAAVPHGGLHQVARVGGGPQQLQQALAAEVGAARPITASRPGAPPGAYLPKQMTAQDTQ